MGHTVAHPILTDAPVVAPELGAFERRKFDPDAARSGAAGAL